MGQGLKFQIIVKVIGASALDYDGKFCFGFRKRVEFKVNRKNTDVPLIPLLRMKQLPLPFTLTFLTGRGTLKGHALIFSGKRLRSLVAAKISSFMPIRRVGVSSFLSRLSGVQGFFSHLFPNLIVLFTGWWQNRTRWALS